MSPVVDEVNGYGSTQCSMVCAISLMLDVSGTAVSEMMVEGEFVWKLMECGT